MPPPPTPTVPSEPDLAQLDNSPSVLTEFPKPYAVKTVKKTLIKRLIRRKKGTRPGSDDEGPSIPPTLILDSEDEKEYGGAPAGDVATTDASDSATMGSTSTTEQFDSSGATSTTTAASSQAATNNGPPDDDLDGKVGGDDKQDGDGKDDGVGTDGKKGKKGKKGKGSNKVGKGEGVKPLVGADGKVRGLSKEYWMSDKNCAVCYECETPFTLFFRRHHCRLCGQIFCAKCSKKVPAHFFANLETKKRSIRVCTYCFQGLVAAKFESGSPKLVITENVAPLHDDETLDTIYGTTQFDEEGDNEVDIIDVDHMARDSNHSASNNADSAPGMGSLNQRLSMHDDDDADPPLVVDSITGLLRPGSVRVTTVGGLDNTGLKRSSPSTATLVVRELSPADRQRKEILAARGHMHLSELLSQLLKENQLDMSWMPVILQLCSQAVRQTQPQLRTGDRMDLALYVKVKKIPGGRIQDSKFVPGVVMSKHVVNKRMRSVINNPKILVLACAIDYQRVEHRFSSLEHVVKQEEEYLTILVSKIVKLKPDIVVVRKTISRLAQDLLMKEGISLVTCVKVANMQRIARVTGADIIPSLDALRNPRLGTCDRFRVDLIDLRPGKTGLVPHTDASTIPHKALMYFEGYPEKLQSTLVLHGAAMEVLAQVKSITEFVLFVGYNITLEADFLLDEGAVPVEAGEVRVGDDVTGTITDSVYQSVSSRGTTGTVGSIDPLHRPDIKVEEPAIAPRILASSPGITFTIPPQLIQALQVAKEAAEAEVLAAQAEAEEENAAAAAAAAAVVAGGSGDQDTEGSPTRRLERSTGSRANLSRASRKSAGSLGGRGASHGNITGGGSSSGNGAVTTSSNNGLEVGEVVPEHEDTLAVLSPFDFQSIIILFSSHCITSNTHCIEPEIRTIAFYSDSDMSIGQYLDQSCFNPHCQCLSSKCRRSVLHHARFYTHNNGRMSILVEKRDGVDDPGDSQVYMWSFCKICKLETEVKPMSEGAWNYSFGKFLELSFYNFSMRSTQENCPHSLHHDHIRCFRRGKLIARFDYEPFILYDVAAPTIKIPTNLEIAARLHETEMGVVRRNARDIFSEVESRFATIIELDSNARELTDKLRIDLVDEKDQFFNALAHHEMGQDILDLNTLKTKLAMSTFAWNETLRNIHAQLTPSAENVIEAGGELRTVAPPRPSNSQQQREQQQQQQFLTASPKHGPRSDMSDLSTSPGSAQPSLATTPTGEGGLQERMQASRRDSLRSRAISQASEDGGGSGAASPVLASPMVNAAPSSTDSAKPKEHTMLAASARQNRSNSSLVPTLAPGTDDGRDRAVTSPIDIAGNGSGSRSQAHSPAAGHTPPVANTPGYGMVPVGTGVNSDHKARTHVAPPAPYQEIPLPFQGSRGYYFLPPGISEKVVVIHDNEPSSVIAYTLCTGDYHQELMELVDAEKGIERETPETTVEVTSTEAEVHLDRIAKAFLDNDAFDQLSKKKRQADRKRHHSGPLPASADKDTGPRSPGASRAAAGAATGAGGSGRKGHRPSSSVVSKDSDARLAVEPSDDGASSSVIDGPAETDDSIVGDAEEHDSVMEEGEVEGTGHVRSKTGTSTGTPTDSATVVPDPAPGSTHGPTADAAVGPAAADLSPPADTTGVNEDGMSATEAALRSHRQNHIKLRIETSTGADGSKRPTRFYCTVYYATQFKALREMCCESEESYIASLSRSEVWAAEGGKSGSTFSKTMDGRYIIKRISKIEIEKFLLFAPEYFEYLAEALFNELPTCLCKILGVYRVGKRQGPGGASGAAGGWKEDVIVMENLFYDRNIAQTFDLKGSVRNRLVKKAGENAVLLDENLLEYEMSPLVVQEHSKYPLMMSLWNDTLFLSNMNVMDYSLLVGLDEDRQELVVGVIDYVRRYTWDKQLETWVKSSGLLGGKGKDPTVISPLQYKKRFREAMDKYFMMVPNKFTGINPQQALPS